MVTGGSDGIGLAMCQNLASQGFNICIMSRNGDKIEKCLEKIRSQYGVQTKCIVADLAKITTVEGYKRLI